MTRADVFLPILLRRLREAGLRPADVTVYMATGTHIRFTAEDRAAVFGDGLPAEVRVVAHDCKDRDGLVHLGTSRFVPVKLRYNGRPRDAAGTRSEGTRCG